MMFQEFRLALEAILFVSFILAFLQGNWAMLRTAMALLACLVVNRIHFLLTNDSTPYVWYMVIDAITAAIVLARPAGRVQGIIGISYIVELCMHMAYRFNMWHDGYSYPAQMRYWYILFGIAIVQALLLGGWVSAELVGHSSGGIFHRQRGISQTTHPTRLG